MADRRLGIVDDDRAVAPVVGKALEAGIVVLYVGLLTSALYGHAVPTYQTTAGDAVAERALSAAAQRVEAAVPPNASRVDARVSIPLPDTIRGETYTVEAENRSLVLDHDHPSVAGRQRLALPPSVVAVSTTDGGLAVELVEGES